MPTGALARLWPRSLRLSGNANIRRVLPLWRRGVRASRR